MLMCTKYLMMTEPLPVSCSGQELGNYGNVVHILPKALRLHFLSPVPAYPTQHPHQFEMKKSHACQAVFDQVEPVVENHPERERERSCSVLRIYFV